MAGPLKRGRRTCCCPRGGGSLLFVSRFRQTGFMLQTGESKMDYPNVQLLIDGKWRPAASGKTIPVLNPATEEVIGTVAHAGKADLDEALVSAEKGFKVWRAVSTYERSR